MRRLLLAIAILSAVLAGCSKHASEPSAPAITSLAPALLATQPTARTASAAYDSEIWAQFDRALDGRTVTPLNVFLKLDGQRITITVSYDVTTRRVFLHPTSVLALQRTYTVEFSPNVRGLDGTPLPPGVFFQFTTNSLRRILYDYPAEQALEGPVSSLGWGGTKGPDGNIFYEVYASSDSLAVVRRATPILQRSVFTRYLTNTAWPLGTRIWWAVTSENLTTHERMDGDIHSFQVLDASTPLESVVIKAQDHGSNFVRAAATTQFCASLILPAGPLWNAGIHWNYGPLPANIRIASATMQISFTSILANTFNGTKPSVWQAQNDWVACIMRGGGAPFVEQSGLLASAVQADSIRNDFASDRLSSFLEAQYRHRTLLSGTLIRAIGDTNFNSPFFADPTKVPQVLVSFYRLP